MTGWPPHLLQDDSRKLSDWFASRVDARWTVRQVCAEIERTRIMNDHIIKAAKEAGGTTYTNRHHDGTACAFGPEALERFYAIAYQQGMERAAEICEAQHEEDRPSDYAYAIRAEAHAQNQPKNVHDGSVV